MQECPSFQVLFDYLQRELQSDQVVWIEAHLQHCAACRSELHRQQQQIRQVKTTLEQLDPAPGWPVLRPHRSMPASVSSELNGLHFKLMPVKEEPSGERGPSLSIRSRRMAIAACCFIVLCAVIWVLWKPVSKPAGDPALSAYAESYHYLDMCRADSLGTSGFATPLVVIIQAGVPARIIELDGTTDVSDALK